MKNICIFIDTRFLNKEEVVVDDIVRISNNFLRKNHIKSNIFFMSEKHGGGSLTKGNTQKYEIELGMFTLKEVNQGRKIVMF